MKTLITLLGWLFGTYLLICALAYLMQRHLIYFPTPETILEDVQSFQLETPDAKLKVWRLNPDATKALLYFGGNAEDVAANIPTFRHIFPNHAVYLMNYRGYGGSGGSPSEPALMADALALFDRVAAKHTQISVIGRSLGSGVAVQLAARRTVDRLILLTPFDSLVALARHHYPWLPIAWLLKDRFESDKAAAQIDSPVLIVAAEQDFVVPRSSTARLISRFAEGQVRVEIIPHSHHNWLNTGPEYPSALRQFLAAEPNQG